MYNDESSSGILLASNLVHDTQTGAYHMHFGETNIVRNNIFAYSTGAQLQRTRLEDRLAFTFENNVVFWHSGTLFAACHSSFTVENV